MTCAVIPQTTLTHCSTKASTFAPFVRYQQVIDKSTSKSTSFYRQDAAKRQTAGIKFTHRPKSGFSPRTR